MLVLIPQIYVKERSDIQLFMDCIYVPSQHSTEESEEHIPPKEMEAFEMLVCCQHVVSQISFQASLGGVGGTILRIISRLLLKAIVYKLFLRTHR